MRPPEEVKRLAADIAENGLLMPVLVDSSGLVVAGRTRLRACAYAKVEPRFRTLGPDEDPFAVAASENAMRRDLSKGQRAVVAAMYWDYVPSGHGGARARAQSCAVGKRSARLGQQFGTSARSVEMARAVLLADRELAMKVRAGNASLMGAYRTVAMGDQFAKGAQAAIDAAWEAVTPLIRAALDPRLPREELSRAVAAADEKLRALSPESLRRETEKAAR